MSIQPRLGLFFLGGCLLAAAPCSAATLQPAQGEVFVSHGQGYQLVTRSIEVNPGDAVMVNPNGGATIVYDGGCSVPVQPGAIATIAPQPPCGGPLPPEVAQAVDQAPPPHSDSTAIGLGAAGVGLGAAALGVGIYAISQHNSNTTVNPTTCGTAVNPCYTKVSP